PGQTCREPMVRPAPDPEIHPQSPEKLVRQTKKWQRPGKGQQQINQGKGIQRQGIPLRKKRNPATTEWIPQGQLTPPESLAMEIRQRITEHSEVANDKRAQAEKHGRESHG